MQRDDTVAHADMNGKGLQMLVTHFLSLSLSLLSPVSNTLPLLLHPKSLLTLHTQLYTNTAQQSPQSVSQSVSPPLPFTSNQTKLRTSLNSPDYWLPVL